MAYCGKCGTKVDEGVKFCPSCGKAMEAPASEQQAQTQQAQTQQAQTQQAQTQQAQTAGDQNDFSAKIAALNNTADTTADFDKADIEQNKLMGIMAYLSWLVLIPIFAAPKSKFARFHANQGLVLAITEVAWWIVTAILNAILYAISWRLGSLVGTLLGLVNLVFLVMLVLGIMNAVNGRAKELPVIGKFKILK